MQFSTIDVFGILPSPSRASHEFLYRIGLQPEPFQEWLRSINSGLADSSSWSDVLRLYAQFCDEKFKFTGDPVSELQQYGLTQELSALIVKNVGARYGAMLLSQYVVSAVETRLSMALSH